jgi:hypothetical protein
MKFYVNCLSGRPIELSGRPPSGRKHLASGRPCENSRITCRTRKELPVQMRVPQTPFLTQFRPSKAYKQGVLGMHSTHNSVVNSL